MRFLSIKNIIMYAAFAAFLYFGFQLFHPYYELWQQHLQITALQNAIQKNTLDGEQIIDWQTLQQQNSDIIAWITIPDTNIDYPIVQGYDNAYYLQHDIFKQVYYARRNLFRCTLKCAIL